MHARPSCLVLALIAGAPPCMAQQAPEDFEAELMALLNTKIAVASKSAERSSDAPAIISVLTQDDLKRFGGTTLKDVLNRVPGLINVSNYFTDRSMMAASGDNMRNSASNRHVLVLLDGRPLREVQEGGIKTDFYEAFPVDAVERIEVIKGPGSVLYGSEAYSAVINVVTDKPKTTGGMAAVGFGVNHSYKHAAKLDVASGDFNLTGTFQTTRRPDWDMKWASNAIPDGKPFVYKTQGAGAFLRGTYKGFSMSGAFVKYDTPYAVTTGKGTIDDCRQKKAFLDVGHNFVVNDKWNITANLTYNRSWFRSLNYLSGPAIQRDSYETLGEITSFYSFTDKTRLIAGGLYSKSTGTEKPAEGATGNTTTGSRPGSAIYAQLDSQMSDSLKGIIGFQALKVGDGKGTVVPRLGLIWSPTEHCTAKLLYAEAFRAPYINENYLNYANTLFGNTELGPEKVKSMQLGFTYRASRGEVSASVFKNKQSDFIAFVPQGAISQYQNSGSATIEGVELEGKLFLSREWFLVGSALWQSTPVNEKSLQKERTGYADSSAKAGISYAGSLATVSLFDVYQGSIPSELINPTSKNPQAGRYHLLSLHCDVHLSEWMGFSDKMKVNLVIEGDNMLNKELWVPTLGDRVTRGSLPMSKGRNILFGLKGKF